MCRKRGERFRAFLKLWNNRRKGACTLEVLVLAGVKELLVGSRRLLYAPVEVVLFLGGSKCNFQNG
jgi:hypothetical protein